MAIQQLKTAYLQIVSRTALLALALIFLAACSKEEETTTLSTSQQSVLLRSDTDSETSFKVTSNKAWTAQSNGTGFSFTPAEGVAGTTVVTVKAESENSSSVRTELGTLTLRSLNNKTSATVSILQSPQVVAQTVIMYLPWSGNLYDAFQKNIRDAKTAVASNLMHGSRMLVFLQTSATQGRLSELYYDDGQCIEKELCTYTDLNVTELNTITDLFNEFFEIAPARQYGLTVGSHGMAWVPAPSGRMLEARRTGEPQWHWEFVSPDGQFTRWFGDGSTRSTNTTTFADGITATGKVFEYILFDDCFMSSIEVAYDLRHITRHIIASPCEVMAYGYPYDLVVPYLFTDEGTSYSLEGICRSFYNFYENYQAPNYNCGAIAVTVCDEVDNLVSVMRRINLSSPAYVPDPEKPLQQYDYIYYPCCFYDLGDYVSQLAAGNPLLTEFDDVMQRLMPSKYLLHTEYFYSGGKRLITTYSGISTSAPSTNTRYVTPYIQNTGWYQATH